MESIAPPAAVSVAPVPLVDRAACDGCGRCVDVCPSEAAALVYDASGAAVGVLVDPARCTYCTDCENACPSLAIRCAYEIVAVWQTARTTRRPR